MGVVEGIYRCLCGFESVEKSHMNRHLNRKTPCAYRDSVPDSDATFYGEKRKQEDISHLTTEEKKERFLKQCLNNTTKLHMVGNMTIKQLSRKILGCMKDSTHRRKHGDVLWNEDDILKILEANKHYIVPDTILGDIIFPMTLTNGYHNTPSFDRINNDLGYFIENVEVRPHFLNTTHKLTTAHIKNIIHDREQKQNENELINISRNINLEHKYDINFFYYLAKSIKRCYNKKHNRRIFDFESLEECMIFLIKQYIKQGGRCVYSNIPIYPETNHEYKISPERIHPGKNYSKDNLILITVGLNGPPSGQFLNKNLTDEQRETAIESAKFNSEYWNKCTKITPELSKKIEDLHKYGEKILTNNLNVEIRKKLNI